jgi:multidrug efflux pump subunit AcrB
VRRFNLSEWAVTNPSLVLFMILALMIGGALSFLRLGRAEDPSFTIKVATIQVIWPGATATEIQEQVTEKIEKKLQELPFFFRVRTYAKPGFAALTMEFRDNTPPREVPQLFYQVRKKLDDLAPDLPRGVIGPRVNDEFGDVDSVLLTLTSDGTDFAQMKTVAEALKKRFLRLDNVVKVNIYGNQAEKVFVEFSHARLATLGIPPQAIFESLQKQNAITPAGTIETSAQRVPLRVTGSLDGVRAVEETPVSAGGRIFRLGDIATVTRGFEDPPTYILRQRGKPALAIGIVMQRGSNVIELGTRVDTALAEFQKVLPRGFDIERIADQPHVVEKAIREFENAFIEALAIVLVVSFLSLGWRTGIVVAFSVPLVLSIVFMTMNALGIDLHRITLGALIIALGLLVDDAIIAVEMMVRKMEEGWERTRAASYAWTSTAFPMLTGTLITAVGFLPVGFANSAVGEYAGGIFWVVMLALIASWFVAVIFTPYIGAKILPDFAKGKAGHEVSEEELFNRGFYPQVRRLISACVRWRYLVILGVFGVFGLAILGFGIVQKQFFPISERPELFL